MKFEPQDQQNELTSIFDSILRTDFEFKLSIPRSDPDDQFYSLVQCLDILNKSKQKYIKELESELKKLEYDDNTYKALSLTIKEGKEGRLDVSNKRTRNLIDGCLLRDVLERTNHGDLVQSEIKNESFESYNACKTPTKEMLSRVSLIPTKKSKESKMNFEKRVQKALSSRYKKGSPFTAHHYMGVTDFRTRLIYFQGKFIPLLFPMSQFPLHACMDGFEVVSTYRANRDVIVTMRERINSFAWNYFGPMLSILAMKTWEVHARLSQEYFDENKLIYRKIDSLLQTYQHNEININHSISLVQLLLRGFDESMDAKLLFSKISPWQQSPFFFGGSKRVYEDFSNEIKWARLDLPFHDLKIQPNFFWNLLKEDLEDYSFTNPKGLPLLTEFLFRSFNSFSDGFGGSSRHNKVKAEDKSAINIIERIKSHIEHLKKPFFVGEWLKAELTNYYTKSFTQDDNKNKNDIDYLERIPNEILQTLCTDLVTGFTREEGKIRKNLKKYRKAMDAYRDMDIGSYLIVKKSKEWVQKNIPNHLLFYLSTFYTCDDGPGEFKALKEIANKIKKIKKKPEDTKEDLTPEEYDTLRRNLMIARKRHRTLQDMYLSEDSKKRELKNQGRTVVPRKDLVPEELFTLKKTYKKSSNKDAEALITEVLQIIEQNPAIGVKLIMLMQEEIDTYPKRSFIEKRVLWRVFQDYVTGKVASMVDTHIYSLADSLSRILLIANSVYPYKDGEDNDRYKKIIDEIKNLIAFFEHYLEGLIETAPCSYRPVNQKLLAWEITNNLKAIKKYFLTLEYAQIDVKNEPGLPAYNNDFSREQIFLISKKREERKVLNEKSITACLQSELFKKKKDYQKYNYIQKQLGKKKSGLKRSQKRLERSSAINWLKARPGNARYRNLRYGDWTEDVGYYHFSLTHLNTK